MERFTKKQALGICVALTAVFLVILLVVVLNVQSCNEKREQERYGYVDRIVRFTDQATDISYDIGFSGGEKRIPYDGLEHTFAYEVLSLQEKKPLGQSGKLSKKAKEPGKYWFTVETTHNGYNQTFTLELVIEEPEKLQPIMKFDPLDAIEVIDGEYYKYRYNGEYQYPLAYAEYEGERLEAEGPSGFTHIYFCKNLTDETWEGTYPRETGKYSVGYMIMDFAEDPNNETYKSVNKTITIEIVE